MPDMALDTVLKRMQHIKQSICSPWAGGGTAIKINVSYMRTQKRQKTEQSGGAGEGDSQGTPL